MRELGTDDAVYLPGAARRGVELGADRLREARPSCKDGLAGGGPVQREEVEGGFRAGHPGERVVDCTVGPRR